MDPSKRPKVITIVYAIHNFQAENPDELSFSAGEAIEVTEKDDLYGDGWWQGRNTKGQLGLFPQAYTVPAASIAPTQAPSHSNQPQSNSKPQLQPTMNETLFEVQNAIDQLHHPSPSTISLPPSFTGQASPLNGPSRPTNKSDGLSEDGDDPEDRDSTLNLHNNPAQTRALLAQKAQADSNHNHSLVMERLKNASGKLLLNHRASSNSLVSIPGIGDIELSEESGGEDEPAFDLSSYTDKKNSTSNNLGSHRSNVPKADPRRPSKDSIASTTSITSPSPKIPPHSQLIIRQSFDSSCQPPFKAGPFSAAAMAFGLTGSPNGQASIHPVGSTLEKGHTAQKPSSSSLLSDMGLDLREHFNLNSAPVASTLRMSRESTQYLSSSSNLPKVDMAAPNSNLETGRSTVLNGPPVIPPLDHGSSLSPQELLNESLDPVKTSPSSRSQENLGEPAPISHQRQASACSTGSGTFLRQQLTNPLHAPQSLIPDTKASVSTADSSSAKGSRSRSSSRVEQFVSVDDQPTSPATSTFPSSAGARQGRGSLSSSHSRSHKPVVFGSFSSRSPEAWTVAEVTEWAKVKGLDDFTITKFTEHHITGDVLLELDVNALKEIELTAFGRRARVIKAIEELKKNLHAQLQGQTDPVSPLSNGTQGTPSIDPSQPPSHLLNPREELAIGSRLNNSKDHSILHYPKAYYPGDQSDREEELVQEPSHHSPSRTSHVRGHASKVSDASGFSFNRRHEKHNSNSSREEINGSTNLSTYNRTSSSSGRPRQATFSNLDSVPASQSHRRQHSRSRSTSENPRRSRASSWTPITESQSNHLSDSIHPVDELDESHDPSPENEDDPKSKKNRKKKAATDRKPPGTANSLKSKKTLPDSPSFRSPSDPSSPDRTADHPASKSRTSFLGNLRVRKPPPKLSSPVPVTPGASSNQTDGDIRPNGSSGIQSSLNGRSNRSIFHFGHDKVQGQTQHQIQHLTPSADTKHLISSPLVFEEKEAENPMLNKKEGETRTALERIGQPDHMGWMRKKGEKYPTWKLRYFILKGSNLYYLKSQNEIRIKGVIKLNGFKVVMDADVHPGRYGFRIIHDNGSFHLFSADDSKLLRDWMKAMMKATIDRDWIAPVISSCNIRTISIRDAQKMFPPPRPPSPSSRARAQKARLATNNPDLLSEKDAAVLMGIQNLQQSPVNHTRPVSTAQAHSLTPSPTGNGSSLRPRKSVNRPSAEKTTTVNSSSPDKNVEESMTFKLTSADQEVLNWINREISKRYDGGSSRSPTSLEAKDFSHSIKNGQVLVRLIESLTNSSSGLKDDQFLKVTEASQTRHRHSSSIIESDDDFDVYFSIFDYLNSQQIPLEGYSLNDLISGDPYKTREFLTRVYHQFHH